MRKSTEVLYKVLASSRNPHDDLQTAMRKLVDEGKAVGFMLASYGRDPRASWRAKPSDLVNTIHTLVEFMTGSDELAVKVCDMVVASIKVSPDDIQ